MGATVENHGVSVYDSSPTLERVTGNAIGGANRNPGFLITGATAFPVVRDVGNMPRRGPVQLALLANFGAQPSVNGVVADASEAFTHAIEYDGIGVGAKPRRVRVGGSNGTNESVGLKINNACRGNDGRLRQRKRRVAMSILAGFLRDEPGDPLECRAPPAAASLGIYLSGSSAPLTFAA